MRYSVAAVAALAAGASAWSNETHPVYTTEVVTAYTTYCPSPTTVVHNKVTYTVKSATTLTITDCPCTVTKPLVTYTSTVCNTCTPVITPTSYSTKYETHVPVYTNATVSTKVYSTPGVAAPTTAVPTTKAPQFTGAANKAFAASGAGLAGLLGLAAYVL
ncbi:MAG: hypothetical protein M1832_004444 [Thelocarpon impressellum]|nr:MAG: hypothetical protein M1832_004444 [Thelocarpon impressellum]